jgi:hypothetical protein
MVRHVKNHVSSHGPLYGIAVTLLTVAVNGWMEHRATAKNSDREGGLAAIAVQTAEEAQLLKATTDSLRLRVRRLERKTGVRTVVIVDTVAVRKKPESHGLLWHLEHPMGR